MSWACVGSWIFPALISVSAIRPPWAGRASHESRAQSQAGMSRCHAGHAGGHRWPTVTTITARCLYITSNNQDPDNSFRQLKRVKLDNLLNVKMTQDLDSGVLSGGCFVDFQKPQTLSSLFIFIWWYHWSAKASWSLQYAFTSRYLLSQ